jgi:hypothetical protein
MARMTLKQLMDRIIEVCPDAMFDENGEGEVVVHTGLVAHPEEDWNEGSLPLTPLTTN